MLHIKGKKHSKATAKLEANLVTETNEEVREQLKEILAEGRQLERMSLADLPIAGQKEKLMETMLNHNILEDIKSTEVWDRIESGEGLSTAADWKLRNKTIKGYRNALFLANKELADTFVVDLRCHLCQINFESTTKGGGPYW